MECNSIKCSAEGFWMAKYFACKVRADGNCWLGRKKIQIDKSLGCLPPILGITQSSVVINAMLVLLHCVKCSPRAHKKAHKTLLSKHILLHYSYGNGL